MLGFRGSYAIYCSLNHRCYLLHSGVCLGSLYCLFSPRNPKHVATFGHMFGRLAPVFGLKVEKRFPQGYEQHGNAIYIANHQNNYDMVTASTSFNRRPSPSAKEPAVDPVFWFALLVNGQPAD
jgi:1-acyl-sn-glycerol-3-phosphate acyltransferase